MNNTERPIDRLLTFAQYCKDHNLCRTRRDFERKCNLSANYLYNTALNTKSKISVDILAKIHRQFPQINLQWVITGEEPMLIQRDNYKEAYYELLQQMRHVINAATPCY